MFECFNVELVDVVCGCMDSVEIFLWLVGMDLLFVLFDVEWIWFCYY